MKFYRLSFFCALHILLLAGIVCWQMNLHAQATSQSVSVTFRLADPQKRYVRAFVPGEFNNWGPNSNGAINAGAPSEMSYDAAAGVWTKTVQLTGEIRRYLYKFHVHRNASGSQWEWFPDPLNDVQDGSSNQNSVLTIGASLSFFQAALDTNAQGLVTSVQASVLHNPQVFGSGSVTQCALIADKDTTNIFPSFDARTGFVRHTLAVPQPRSRVFTLLARGGAQTATYRFLSFINAVPSWARNVVWYQIFPERFRNGDKTNDPTRESLEIGNNVPASWRVKEWGSDWFARDDWERAMSPDFYSSAIFHRRYGGDLQGIIDKLSYLQELGITGVYLNPIFYAASLHKYDASSLHHVDPYFGPNPKGDLEQIARENATANPDDPKNWRWTSADSLFLKLLGEAKRRNIRVIIDGVFNHTGRGFFAFQDIVSNQATSRFKDWYTVTAFDNPQTTQNEFRYKAWEGFESLPELARSADGRDLNAGAKAYVYNVTRRWMDPNGDGNPSDGVDGWRLDVVPYMPIPFWNEWNTFVRTINPEAFTTAEIWTEQSPRFVREGNFSSVMNYWAFTFPVMDFFINRRGTVDDFWNTITSRMNAYSPEVQHVLQNMMDSHDTERLASLIVNKNLAGMPTNNAWGKPSTYNIRKPTQQERDLQKLIALFQATFTGAPMLYYGTESGVWGGNDPDDRSPMNWDDITFAPQAGSHSPAFVRPADDMNADKELRGFYQQLAMLRVENFGVQSGALQKGWLKQIPTSAQTVAFFREFSGKWYDPSQADSVFSAGEAFLTILNATTDSTTVTIQPDLLQQSQLFRWSFGDCILYTHGHRRNARIQRASTGVVSIMLPPYSGVVLYRGIVTEIDNNTAQTFAAQAYPQPFSESTTLEYSLPSAAQVVVRVFDALGREVARFDEGWKPHGANTLTIHGEHWARGAYTCTISASTGAVQRVRLVKQ